MMPEVIEFNRTILGIDKRPIGPMDPTEHAHLTKCLIEEAMEFEDACKYGNMISAIDSLIDSVYFALGGLYKMGLTEECTREIFLVIHGKNMEKRKGVVARRNTGAADAIKPDDWIPPEELISEILDRYIAEEVET